MNPHRHLRVPLVRSGVHAGPNQPARALHSVPALLYSASAAGTGPPCSLLSATENIGGDSARVAKRLSQERPSRVVAL